jgi:hypothetical protein
MVGAWVALPNDSGAVTGIDDRHFRQVPRGLRGECAFVLDY